MTILLMAAGSGSRYGKLKQFDELGPSGEFLMEFSIYDAIKNGFDHIAVSYTHLTLPTIVGV